MTTKHTLQRMLLFEAAWHCICPDKRICGLTLAEFRALRKRTYELLRRQKGGA